LWAVGPRGMLLRSVDDGATWEDRSLGKDITLNGVTFVDDQEGWIVGEFGTILHTVDGGETWQRSEEIEGLPPYVEDVSEEVALRRRRRQGRGAPLPRPGRDLGEPTARASRGGGPRALLLKVWLESR